MLPTETMKEVSLTFAEMGQREDGCATAFWLQKNRYVHDCPACKIDREDEMSVDVGEE